MMSRPNASYTRIFHGSFQFFESSDAPSRLRSSILLIALRWSVRMPEAMASAALGQPGQRNSTQGAPRVSAAGDLGADRRD